MHFPALSDGRKGWKLESLQRLKVRCVYSQIYFHFSLLVSYSIHFRFHRNELSTLKMNSSHYFYLNSRFFFDVLISPHFSMVRKSIYKLTAVISVNEWMVIYNPLLFYHQSILIRIHTLCS